MTWANNLRIYTFSVNLCAPCDPFLGHVRAEIQSFRFLAFILYFALCAERFNMNPFEIIFVTNLATTTIKEFYIHDKVLKYGYVSIQTLQHYH